MNQKKLVEELNKHLKKYGNCFGKKFTTSSLKNRKKRVMEVELSLYTCFFIYLYFYIYFFAGSMAEWFKALAC